MKVEFAFKLTLCNMVKFGDEFERPEVVSVEFDGRIWRSMNLNDQQDNV